MEGKGKVLFNGEKLKSFDEILPEMAIAQYDKIILCIFINIFMQGA